MNRKKLMIMLLIVSLLPSLYSQEMSFSNENVQLEWKFIEGEIEFAFTGKTTGWISIGFEPSKVMKDADIKMISVVGGEVLIEDHFAHAFTGHKLDTALGGSDDFTIISGSEKDGYTTVVFRMPLNSGDSFDRVIEQGKTYKVIFATGRKDSFRTIHNWRSLETITF